MKFNKKKVSVIALSTILCSGTLAGCDFITTNSENDLKQVVAEVNIAKGEAFQEEFGDVASVISTSEILKRDVIAGYMSYGYQYVNSYGYTVENAIELIMDNLVNRQIYIQYATAYLLSDSESGFVKAEYQSAIASGDELSALGYFLDDEEEARIHYTVRTVINNTIDAQESTIIAAEEHEHDHDSERTTPTGIDTANEDYYDDQYAIYTGYNDAAQCGSYEIVEGSTPSTRRKAYGQFLANLDAYALITKGEDTSSFETLSYYNLEIKNAYEDAIIQKLSDAFEAKAEELITADDDYAWVESKFNAMIEEQKVVYQDTAALETALDGVSNTSFVAYAPQNYGFVLNILLPFSTTQSDVLENAQPDAGDTSNNKFVQRAQHLKNIKAADQRKSWFGEAHGYAFEVEEGESFYQAGNAERTYLFFEESVTSSNRYENVPNYYGKYSYNGKVTENEHGELIATPNKITISEFIGEMKGYLNFAGYSLVEENGNSDSYFTKTVSDYYTKDNNGKQTNIVDYSAFVYYSAKVAKDGQAISFNANNMFKAESDENTVFSVMNELSFAYNTDTAGLNTYLGYVVSPGKTNFVPEFEYAAQKAVEMGPGSIVIAPSDYGWHVIYCTFSYAQGQVYTFDKAEVEVEGTFSNLYYESLKSTNMTNYANDRQTQIVNSYNSEACVTTYEDRYSNLYESFSN